MVKIILGGGLSGLCSAYYLSKITQNKIVLLESTNRLGGWIKSERLDKEAIFEQGPRTIRPKGLPGIETLNLIDNLNLNVDIRPINSENSAAKNRLIYANKELHYLPNSFFSMLKTQKPFSKPIIRHILNDLTATRKKLDDDSIYEFTKRRFGHEVADFLIDPLICGICAGNSKEISVKFLMKQLFHYEQTYGSIAKGLANNIFNKSSNDDQLHLGPTAMRSKKEKWNVYTFKNGIETLPIALQCDIQNKDNVEINLNCKSEEIRFNSDGATVILENGKKFHSKHVFSGIAAANLGSMLINQHPKLAENLFKIKTVTVGVVNLYFKGNLIENPAFGFLVPPREKLPILGVIYDSCLQNLTDKTVLTVMMGGYWFKNLFSDSPKESLLLDVALENLRTILGINTEPIHYKVNILKNCIPQYTVGHEKNLEEIHNYIREKKLPLSLCGSSYNGVGVNDVILSAKNAVKHYSFP